jgi:hypothetical protein
MNPTVATLADIMIARNSEHACSEAMQWALLLHSEGETDAERIWLQVFDVLWARKRRDYGDRTAARGRVPA